MNTKFIPFHIFITLILTTLQNNTSAQTDLVSLCKTSWAHEYSAYFATLDQSTLIMNFRDEFCTKELMHKNLLLSIHKSNNYLIACASHTGYTKFGTLSLKLGYGRKFGNTFSVTMLANYLMEHAEHYKVRNSGTVELSATYQINRKLGIALNLYNPIRLHYEITGPEVIPMQFATQISYQPDTKLITCLFGYKYLPGDWNCGMKIYYAISPIVNVMGIFSKSNIGGGINLSIKQFNISVNADWYFKIGFSPETGIRMYWQTTTTNQ